MDAFTKSIKAVAIVSVVVAAFGATIIAWPLIAPRRQASVDLPIDATVARIEQWWGIADFGKYEIVLSTPRGSVRSFLFTNIETANRTNLYVTPDRVVAALGAGGEATFISVPENAAPHEISARELADPNSDTWIYVGAVDLNEKKQLQFFSPQVQTECFPMLSAGESPFRRKYQVQHSCANGRLIKTVPGPKA